MGIPTEEMKRPASSDETSATVKPRRSKGLKLEADEGSNLSAD